MTVYHRPVGTPGPQEDLFSGGTPAETSAPQESVAMLGLATVEGVGYKSLYAIKKSGKRFEEFAGSSSPRGTVRLLEESGVRNAEAVADHITAAGSNLLQRGHEALAELEKRNVRLIHSFEPDFP